MADDNVVPISKRFPGAIPVDEDEEVEVEIPAEGVRLEDFYADIETHKYIFAPTGALCPAASVNERLPLMPVLDANGDPRLDASGKPVKLKASVWLSQNRSVEQMTWAPGMPLIIEDRLLIEGGWDEHQGARLFNLYHPPRLEHGDPEEAWPWLKHLFEIYPDDAVHIVDWLAQRVQHPEIKINHALILSGEQGIGKDTILEPVTRAVGPWNVAEVSPKMVMGRFNGFAKSVILRISEAHDLGDFNRYQFYEHLKAYCVTPPNAIRVDTKNRPEYNTLNCCGVIITTNHKTDALHLPAGDRRDYVAWSDAKMADYSEGYYKRMWEWFDNGGAGHVAAFLAQHDLNHFNPKAPPRKTEAFWDIVNSGRPLENGELADLLDLMVWPDVLTLRILIATAKANNGHHEFGEWLADRKNRKAASYRLRDCGYVPIRNPDDVRDGQWQIFGHRQTVYGKASLSLAEQIAAARELDGVERAEAERLKAAVDAAKQRRAASEDPGRR